MTDISGFHRDTQALHAGRNPKDNFGVVNPPV